MWEDFSTRQGKVSDFGKKSRFSSPPFDFSTRVARLNFSTLPQKTRKKSKISPTMGLIHRFPHFVLKKACTFTTTIAKKSDQKSEVWQGISGFSTQSAPPTAATTISFNSFDSFSLENGQEAGELRGRGMPYNFFPLPSHSRSAARSGAVRLHSLPCGKERSKKAHQRALPFGFP
ncbi:MAG: hypothetical protein J6R04_02815 [Clostridia bacterium]|nr:hypothetical protein [Clostridia bacterium]